MYIYILYIYIHIYIYIYIYLYMYIYIYIYIAYIYTYIYILAHRLPGRRLSPRLRSSHGRRIHLHIHIYIYICIYKDMDIYLSICIHLYINIYTLAHRLLGRLPLPRLRSSPGRRRACPPHPSQPWALTRPDEEPNSTG